MGFPFRSIFQSTSDAGGGQEVSAAVARHANSTSANAQDTGPLMNPAPPLNSASSPFSVGAPLFRTVSGESLQPQSPTSPFATANSSNTGAPLTVSDILPQLPPDVARPGALSPDQPVVVSAQVIEAALRSGQAALPIFEVYRVCPALFQTPVSPQDPRMVPLPASKLPRLIAITSGQPQIGASDSVAAANPGAAPGTSPFSFAPVPASGMAEPPPLSGFPVMAQPQPAAPLGGTILPPRRQGPPPPLADLPRDIPQLSLPEATPPAPLSPGFQASSGVGSPGSDAFPASPFGGRPQNLQPAQPGLFGGQPEAGAASPFAIAEPGGANTSPFGVAPSSPSGTPPASGAQSQSPFGFANPVPAGQPQGDPAFSQASANPPGFGTDPSSSSPPPLPAAPPQQFGGGGAFPTASPPSPFSIAPSADAPSARPSVPQGNGVSPFGAAPQTSFSLPAVPALSNGSPSPGSAGQFRISLASLLRGCSFNDLGFDPAMVPAWIMTSLPAGPMRDLLDRGNATADLGMLVDGITDVGFRHVLSQAKRDFQLNLPAQELAQALNSGSSANGASALPTLGGSQAPVSMPLRVEPPSPPPGQTALPINASPAPASPVPFLTPTFPSSAPAPVEFTPAPSTPGSSGFSSPFAQPSPASPPAKAADPFAAARPPEPPAPSAPSWPQAPAAQFGGALPNAQPPAAAKRESPTSASDFFSTKADPKPTAVSEGFGSAELLGSAPAFAPAPELPPLSRHSAPGPALEEPDQEPTSFAAFPVANPRKPAPAAAEPPAPMPAKAASPSRSAATPVLGLRPLQSSAEQILLRALLGTDEELSPKRVVELASLLPGIAACVCLKGNHQLSHAGAHKPQAREFQKQATELAHHLRTLAPLIGIEGAETFTLNAGDRLMTFCFPEGAILGVLHDDEPCLGLRDKITLIARELSRMLD